MICSARPFPAHQAALGDHASFEGTDRHGGTNYGLMAAAVTLVVVPVIILYAFLQKYIIKGMVAGAVKG